MMAKKNSYNKCGVLYKILYYSILSPQYIYWGFLLSIKG